MESRAKFLGHSLHQMLIVFPLGLLTTSLLFDIAGALTKRSELYTVSYWMIAVGVIGGLLAGATGLIDWLAIPKGTRARAVGLIHAITNVAMLALFAITEWLRYNAPGNQPDVTAIVLSFIAVGISLFAAWLGGELVDRLGVGIDTGANLDAPSSLTGKPATEVATPLAKRGA